ncbi:putative spermidine/putrescine transport system permease protein [Caloramator fervidus]|uniref:Putative spermidine/putrescine transport system permease protein n=1 Tax=Caloramator fervidus TaxID=29344 RepID=A0A1H5TAD2_9CLOT|nr:ABC transporter permease subunit [Caloramator fervidus]SEF58947.1 putative spermidine/putrescine transport system permease protein [Caloramator fervidus]
MKGFLKNFIILVLILPLLIMFLWSIVNSWPWPYILPQDISFRAFLYIFEPSTKIFRILINSILLSAIVTFFTLLISLPAAKALAFYDFKGKSLVKVLLLLPLIVPILSVAMGIHLSFIRLGIANTYLGVILIHVIPGIPYGVKILLNVFELNGNKMEFQARTLGASKLQVLRYITLPMIMPGLIVAGSIIYISSFTQYFITFLIGGGKIVTYSMVLFPFIESGDRTMASALSVIFVINIGIVLYISEKLVGNIYKNSSKYFV